jgi:hypothetical protein
VLAPEVEGLDDPGVEVGVEVGLPEPQGSSGVGELDLAFGDEAVDEASAAAEVGGGAVDVVQVVGGVGVRTGTRGPVVTNGAPKCTGAGCPSTVLSVVGESG